jgi:hypothetical protein
MYKRFIICLILFIAVGEVMIRIDDNIESNRIIKIPLGLRETPEYNMLKENKINLTGNNLRILVIGDSYIAGGGINPKDRFSQKLKSICKTNNNGFDDVIVLDVSQANANTLDNNQTYFQFVDRFKPHFVIIGYNLDDIMGNLDKQKEKIETGITPHEEETNSHVNESLIQKIYYLYQKSRFLGFTLRELHSELKVHGIVIPNSIFDVTMKSYLENKENWQKSKLLLQEVIEDAKIKNIQLIVLKLPELNLLEHKTLFVKPNQIIKDFFNQFTSVIFINGDELFNGENSKDYSLSKYDGHPNEKAHKKMAIEVSHYVGQYKGK